MLVKKFKSDNVKKFLQKHGAVHLPSALDKSRLTTIATAADGCFTNIERLIQRHGARQVKDYLPVKYLYLERSTSLSPIALDDYQNDIKENILDIFSNSAGMSLLVEMLGGDIVCNHTKSRVAKQYAPVNYHSLHSPNSWHQDGALGVPFPNRDSSKSSQFFSANMTQMVICWIPLVDCLGDCPGLQLVRKPLERLLHYEYLNDSELEKIFEPNEFWVPQLKFGDMLIFLNGTLHRTFVTDTMKNNRTSIELRFIISSQIPDWMQNDQFWPISF